MLSTSPVMTQKSNSPAANRTAPKAPRTHPATPPTRRPATISAIPTTPLVKRPAVEAMNWPNGVAATRPLRAMAISLRSVALRVRRPISAAECFETPLVLVDVDLAAGQALGKSVFGCRALALGRMAVLGRMPVSHHHPAHQDDADDHHHRAKAPPTEHHFPHLILGGRERRPLLRKVIQHPLGRSVLGHALEHLPALRHGPVVKSRTERAERRDGQHEERSADDYLPQLPHLPSREVRSPPWGCMRPPMLNQLVRCAAGRHRGVTLNPT